MSDMSLHLLNFGDILRAARKRRKLTQKHLAQMLDVHYNTISAWELGTYLPDTRGLVMELAHCLTLDEQESRQLLEASLMAPLPRWNVPYQRNPFFTGCESVLQEIHDIFQNEQASEQGCICALSGLAGIGKTQCAIEYAYRFNHEYFAVFWLNAQTAESLLASVIALASLLNLPEWQEQEQQRIVTAVVHWLNRHDQWLLIFDNVDDVALVKAFLPAAHHGSLLFTSRRQSLGFTSQVLDLGYMSLENGVQFLLHRAGFLTQASAHALAPSEQSAAQEIVAAMGGLPLALDQAGSYIEASRCSFSEYLHLYQVAQFRLLDEREAHADHAESVARTFALIFTRLKQQDVHARELLIACAFLAPEAIPEAFFREGASVLGSLLQTLAADPFAFYAAVKTLRMFSLLQRDVSTQTLMMHRLVQVVLKEELSPEERKEWTRRVMQALCQAFPLSESTRTDYWRGCEQLLPHAMYLLQSNGRVEAELALECTALMNRVALYLIERAAYSEAESLLHKALEMGRCILGEEHPHVADTLFAQGNLLLRQGKYEQAETLSVRALQMRERELGPDHLQVALSLYGLGLLYARQSRYPEAERLYQRALTIREQSLGSDHPQVATTLTALAITYAEQGCYAEAEQLNLRALTIREQTLGSDHPQVATLLNNMAHDYTEQSRYTEAEPLFQRALQIWQQHLGPEHPRVAYPLNNLAELYQAQGRYEEAEPLFRQALRIWEQKLGTEHFLVADPVSGLAHIAREQGKLEEAEVLYRRSLQIREKALGPQHPYVALSLTGLAQLAQLQKNYREAISFYQQVLQIKERTLAPLHPEIADILLAQASLYQELEQFALALALQQKALPIVEHAFGSDHSRTRAEYATYTLLLQKVNNQEEEGTASVDGPCL